MNHISDILALADQAAEQNIDAVLATVVRTEGSAYRRPGAMMLVCADGRSVGMVSGGCLERHLIERAFWLTRQGSCVQVYQTGSAADSRLQDAADTSPDPLQALFVNEAGFNIGSEVTNNKMTNEKVTSDMEADDDDIEDDDIDESMSFGLGCHGSVHVLFERLDQANGFLQTLKQVRQTRQPIGVATLLSMTPLAAHLPSNADGFDGADGFDDCHGLSCGVRLTLTATAAKTFMTSSSSSPLYISSLPSPSLAPAPLSDFISLNSTKHKAFSKKILSALPELQATVDALSALSGAKQRNSHINMIGKLGDQSLGLEWLVQYLMPPIHLLICGAGTDAMPLVKMAKMLDWRVSVIDSRSHYATRARFMDADLVQVVPLDDHETLQRLSQGAAVAVMSHSLRQDRARLSTLLQLPSHHLGYLGQLGPSYRTERLINEIAQSLTERSAPLAALREGMTRLHYPIGFKLGGDGPEALALGIIAQISAVMYEQAPSGCSTSPIVASACPSA